MTIYYPPGGDAPGERIEMYRNYENPYAIEKALTDAKKRLKEDPSNWDLYEEVLELEERVNFAWQDNEDSTTK